MREERHDGAGERNDRSGSHGHAGGLRREVLGWRPEPDGVTIELALRGTLDGLPLAFVTHDRIVLREGRILERRAQMDPRPLLLAALRRPRAGIPLLAAPLIRWATGTVAGVVRR